MSTGNGKKHDWVWSIQIYVVVMTNCNPDHFRVKIEGAQFNSPMCICLFSSNKKGEGQREGSVYYESIKRNLSKRLILECRCDERLKVFIMNQ